MSGKPKRRVKDRLLDKLPVVGRARRVQGWIRRNKGWFYLALAIVVIFMVGPALRIVATFFSILAPMIRTLLDNPVGRVIFYAGVAMLVGWLLWRRTRERVYRVYGLNAMRAFLDGMNLMILDRWERAIPRFESVVRAPRWINLEDGVPEHRDIRVDAMLKIAFCHLRCHRSNEAKAWLLRVQETSILSDHVRRNFNELRALSYDQSDEIEPETILKELEKADQKDARNRRVLEALRDRLAAAGQLERAARVTKRLVASHAGVEKQQAQEQLALLEHRIAHRALDAGAKPPRALKAHARDPRSAILIGDLALERDDLKGALRAWSRAVSLPVFDRIAKLLADGRLEGEKQRRMLLDLFPYAGTMLVLARHYQQNGEQRKAKAAVERAMEAGGANLEALRIYADALMHEGDDEAATEIYRRALSASFG